jgi:hypothetical protein
MGRMKRLGLFAAVFAVSGAAYAQDAEELIRHGNELRRKGYDDAALREFRRAYDLGATPRAAAQLGLAEQQVKRWGDAERHLTRALRDKDDPWVSKNRRVLDAQLKVVRGQIGRVEVAGEPPGAEVLVNAEIVGTLPLTDPVPVTPGSVRVEVRSAGYLSGAMSVAVTRGQLARVDIKLERDARAVAPSTFDASQAAAQAAPAAQPTPPPAVVIEQPPAKEPEPARSGTGLQTARWVAVGTGGVFLAAGIAGALLNYTNIRDFNTDCGGTDREGRALGMGGGRDATCQSNLDTAKTGKTVAIVGFAGAGVLAITSAILFFAF